MVSRKCVDRDLVSVEESASQVAPGGDVVVERGEDRLVQEAQGVTTALGVDRRSTPTRRIP